MSYSEVEHHTGDEEPNADAARPLPCRGAEKDRHDDVHNGAAAQEVRDREDASAGGQQPRPLLGQSVWNTTAVTSGAATQRISFRRLTVCVGDG